MHNVINSRILATSSFYSIFFFALALRRVKGDGHTNSNTCTDWNGQRIVLRTKWNKWHLQCAHTRTAYIWERKNIKNSINANMWEVTKSTPHTKHVTLSFFWVVMVVRGEQCIHTNTHMPIVVAQKTASTHWPTSLASLILSRCQIDVAWCHIWINNGQMRSK